MDQQTFLSILHEVGPRWVAIFAAGWWFWRVTPWAGRQAEKLIDAYLERAKNKIG